MLVSASVPSLVDQRSVTVRIEIFEQTLELVHMHSCRFVHATREYANRIGNVGTTGSMKIDDRTDEGGVVPAQVGTGPI